MNLQVFWETIQPWVYAGIGGAIVAALLLPTKLSELLFKSRLDRAIESFKIENQKELEGLRHDLRMLDDKASALRKFALDGFGARSAAITQRRVVAAENLWQAVVEMHPFVTASIMTAPIKWDVALAIAHRQDEAAVKMQKFAASYWQMLKLDDLKPTVFPEQDRPFLNESCWANFSLYRSILTYPVSLLAAVKNGVPPEMINDPKPLLESLKQALPAYSDLVEEFGITALPALRDEVRKLVLNDVTNIVEGRSLDEDHLAQARRIIAAAEQFDRSEPPPSATEIPQEIVAASNLTPQGSMNAVAKVRKSRSGRLGKYLPIETT